MIRRRLSADCSKLSLPSPENDNVSCFEVQRMDMYMDTYSMQFFKLTNGTDWTLGPQYIQVSPDLQLVIPNTSMLGTSALQCTKHQRYRKHIFCKVLYSSCSFNADHDESTMTHLASHSLAQLKALAGPAQPLAEQNKAAHASQHKHCTKRVLQNCFDFQPNAWGDLMITGLQNITSGPRSGASRWLVSCSVSSVAHLVPICHAKTVLKYFLCNAQHGLPALPGKECANHKLETKLNGENHAGPLGHPNEVNNPPNCL